MHAFYQRARREQPIFFSEELGCFVLTRREDVLSVFGDSETFSAVNSQSPIRPFSDRVNRLLAEGGFTREPTQANTDPPKHTRIRSIASQFLNAKQFVRLRPQIVDLTRESIEAMRGEEAVDLVASLTYELPAKVLFLLLGAPPSDAYRVKQWADNRFNMVWGKISEDEEVAAAEALIDYWNYVKALVAEREESPGDDYASFLLEARGGDDDILSMNEIHSLIHGVMLAGHETTTNAASSLLLSLLENEGQWRMLCENPSLVPNAVEEGLRYRPPLITWRRRAKKACEIGGVKLPEGANILLSIVSANRDEDIFKNGEAFDITRGDARKHASFGYGIHFCLGAQLAKLELTILLHELSAVFPNLALIPGQEVAWPVNMGFRGPKSVWVELNEHT
jgi:cytochrome P450